MILGKVIGNIVSVIKDEGYRGKKLLIVQDMNPLNGKLSENYYVSVDLIGIGIGEKVMVVNGSPARSTEETKDLGVDSIIVAKIEGLFFEDKEIILEDL